MVLITNHDNKVPHSESQVIGPPPVYSDTVSSAGLTSSSTAGLSRPRSTNHLFLLEEHKPIVGTHYVDSGLRIPAGLLPALKPDVTEEDRKNVYAKTTYKRIELEINLVKNAVELGDSKSGANSTRTPSRVTMQFESVHGSVKAVINDLRPPEAITDTPMYIEMKGTHNRLTLCLPRSFKGPIRASATHAPVVLSAAVQEETVTITNDTFFLGDLSSYSDDEPWIGDEANLKNEHGKIDIWFTDEYDLFESKQKEKSTIAKLFGL